MILGYKVLHFPNNAVERALSEVVSALKIALFFQVFCRYTLNAIILQAGLCGLF